jgi:hypothetical protein
MIRSSTALRTVKSILVVRGEVNDGAAINCRDFKLARPVRSFALRTTAGGHSILADDEQAPTSGAEGGTGHDINRFRPGGSG